MTEAKNTHRIKAMTEREVKKKDFLCSFSISCAVRARQAGCNEVVKRFSAYSILFPLFFIFVPDVSFKRTLELFIPIMYVICFGRFVCNYLLFFCLFYFFSPSSNFPPLCFLFLLVDALGRPDARSA